MPPVTVISKICNTFLRSFRGVALGVFGVTSSLYGHVHEQVPDLSSTKQSMWYISPAIAAFDSGKNSLAAWPLMSLGYRWQSRHNGLDASFLFTAHPEGVIIYKFNFLYHYIPWPNPKFQWYFGAGGGAGIMWPVVLGVTPELALGCQYQTSGGNQRFVQLQAATPWIPGYGFHQKFSTLSLSYGFGF